MAVANEESVSTLEGGGATDRVLAFEPRRRASGRDGFIDVRFVTDRPIFDLSICLAPTRGIKARHALMRIRPVKQSLQESLAAACILTSTNPPGAWSPGQHRQRLILAGGVNARKWRAESPWLEIETASAPVGWYPGLFGLTGEYPAILGRLESGK